MARSLALVAAFFVALVGALALADAAGAAEPPARAHIGYGPKHPLANAGWRAFLNRLEQEPSGPAVRLFLNGPPPDGPAAIDALARNDHAFGSAALSAFPDAFPYAALLAELGLAGGEDELAAAAAATELLALDCRLCLRAFADRGIVFLGAYSAARYILLSQEPATAPAAFAGLAALTPGSAWDRLVRSLGGVAIEEDGDAGDLFAKREIGAAITTPMELADPEVWSHVRHALIAPLGAYRGGGGFLASAEYWQALQPKERRAIMNAAADGMVGVVWGYQYLADQAIRTAAGRGLKVDAASPELAEAMRAAIAADTRRIADTASERFGVRDAPAFLDRFLLLYDKFAVLLSNAKDATEAAAVIRLEIFDRLDVNVYGMEKER